MPANRPPQTLPETRIVFTVSQLVVIVSSLLTVIGGIIGIVIFLYNQMNRLERLEGKIDNIEKIVTKESRLRKKEYINRFWIRTIPGSNNPNKDSTLFYDILNDELIYQKTSKKSDVEFIMQHENTIVYEKDKK